MARHKTNWIKQKKIQHFLNPLSAGPFKCRGPPTKWFTKWPPVLVDLCWMLSRIVWRRFSNKTCVLLKWSQVKEKIDSIFMVRICFLNWWKAWIGEWKVALQYIEVSNLIRNVNLFSSNFCHLTVLLLSKNTSYFFFQVATLIEWHLF